eukprot:TRINITY_DN4498_c0_g1_i2.p1 TRINITY_DN4498_c0_g1~~TRINITY_DN4498_c0_g1_i2.p1  ORF type:complete len:523 (+),score=91.65 TRINITY_DN4498_c0_g1_i2:150-1571(+)
MSKIARDFEKIAVSYGKIIIREGMMHPEQKTIQPIGDRGIAGGEKYITQGIFFKYANNKLGIYEDEEYAQKAAGHELKGLIRHNMLGIDGLYYPLMVVIEYLGIRLVAVSCLPIGDTLVYGSQNAGVNVYNSSSEVRRIMQMAGEKLNLRGHLCGKRSENTCLLYGPCDIEVHTSNIDGRNYVLDYHRLFPSESIRLGHNRLIKSPHLVRLLRPELVKYWKSPLSSDAYSKFSSHDPEYPNCLSDVDEASVFLNDILIPTFARELDGLSVNHRKTSLGEFDYLKMLTHRSGINLRYLGKIRMLVTSKEWKDLILVDILARTLKSHVKAVMRSASEIDTAGMEKYKDVIVSFLNLIAGDGFQSLEYWCCTIKDKIDHKFVHPNLSEYERDQSTSIRPTNFVYLLRRFQSISGIYLEEDTLDDMISYSDGITLVNEDIYGIKPVIKHTNLALMSEAYTLCLRSFEMKFASQLIRI